LKTFSKTESQGENRLQAEITNTVSSNDHTCGTELKQEAIRLDENLNLNPEINLFQSNIGQDNGEEEEEDDEDE